MPERHELLTTTLKARLVDTRKHLQALEQAVAAFPNDFGLRELEQAWVGSPEERLTAYPVQAGYENVINGSVRIAQDLCELNGWSAPNTEPTSTEAVRLLRINGIIDSKTHAALKDAYERRSRVQHDYIGAAASDVHAATLAVIEHAPLLLQGVALHLQQRE